MEKKEDTYKRGCKHVATTIAIRVYKNGDEHAERTCTACKKKKIVPWTELNIDRMPVRNMLTTREYQIQRGLIPKDRQ